MNIKTCFCITLLFFLIPFYASANEAVGPAGNTYHVIVNVDCNNGADSVEAGTITYNNDGTFTYSTTGIVRIFSFSPAALLDFTLECLGTFATEPFGQGTKITAPSPSTCMGVNDPSGAATPFSFPLSVPVTICNKTAEQCHYFDNQLNTEGGTFDGVPFDRICRRSGNYLLIDTQAVNLLDQIIQEIDDAISFVTGLDDSDFVDPSFRSRILNKLNRAKADIQGGLTPDSVASALNRMNNLLNKINGCPSVPDGGDWVVCGPQEALRALVQSIIDSLNMVVL